MADWTYTPTYTYLAKVSPPPTLINRYEDGKEDRRRKSEVFQRTFVERHVVDGATADAMIDFFKTKGIDVSFTKVSFDPSEPALTEVTVRFTGPIEFAQVGADEFESEIEFLEEV